RSGHAHGHGDKRRIDRRAVGAAIERDGQRVRNCWPRRYRRRGRAARTAAATTGENRGERQAKDENQAHWPSHSACAHLMSPGLKPSGSFAGSQAWPSKAPIWPPETITRSDCFNTSGDRPALRAWPACATIASKWLPRSSFKSGRNGPDQDTANTVPWASTYSWTTVPDSSFFSTSV